MILSTAFGNGREGREGRGCSIFENYIMQNNFFRSGGSSPSHTPRPANSTINKSYGVLESPVIHTDLARITANLSELVHSSDPNQAHSSKIRQHL